MVFSSRFFKGCLQQILFGPFLNTLAHVMQTTIYVYACYFHKVFKKMPTNSYLLKNLSGFHFVIFIFHWHNIRSTLGYHIRFASFNLCKLV